MGLELRIAQKLESVGQLAAGIAHEINTPIQFVNDSVRFLDESFADVQVLIDAYRELCIEAAEGSLSPADVVARMSAAEAEADLSYLRQRVPPAFERSLDGLARMSAIVAAMKDFSRPAQVEQAPTDLNESLRSTLLVTTNEYRFVADVETDFADLPPVVCNASEVNQVFLSLIVNAAQAIGDKLAAGDGSRGTIRIVTSCDEGAVTIGITDTGVGISSEHRERIFDLFFTTKEVGRGTGQGLSIAHSIVARHGGTLDLASEPGKGSTFVVRLPIGGAVAEPAVA
jgi:signal transduction histidine kinase